jgi:hypothetical protein
VGNGKRMMASKVGSLKCCVIQVDRLEFDITLHKVKYVPELWVNLFSINKALKNGRNLSNKRLSTCLSRGSTSVLFDRLIRSTSGSVSGIKLSVLSINQSPIVCNTIDINEFHKMLGHCGLYRLEKTAKIHDLKLSGDFKTCEECAIATSKQKNINKEWNGGSQMPGEQLYLDISSIH